MYDIDDVANVIARNRGGTVPHLLMVTRRDNVLNPSCALVL